MKKLTKIKLINWHSFINETISLQGSALLSGENGAGKSTILDAIQFVMMASKNNFNKAAHETGNRKLTGYVRYKTGREKKPYERVGNVTCHVALEFFEETKGEYFLAGAVVDSASEDSEKTIWYFLDDTRISDELFFDAKGQIYSIDKFHRLMKQEHYFKTQTEARSAFRHRFGRLEEKFFDLVPKSLAFKPIDDIKDFVYSYVLDKKEVNIEELRENIMTYQSLTIQLQEIKKRVEKLQNIVTVYDRVKEAEIEKIGMDYFLAKLSKEKTENQLEKKQQELISNQELLEVLKKQEESLRNLRESSIQQYQNLLTECKSNQDFLALDAIEKELGHAEKNYENIAREKLKIEEKIEKSVEDVKKLQKILGEKELWKKYISLFSYCDSWDQSISVDYLKNENQKIQQILSKDSIENIIEKSIDKKSIDKKEDRFFKNYITAEKVLELVMEYKQELKKDYQKKEFELQGKKKKMLIEGEKIYQNIKKLEKKNLVYPPKVLKLKAAIEKELKRAGRDGEVQILCELLNVSRETWKNAVEGYLNQQRFYLLVEPKNFDLAASAYDTLHKRENFYGAGIINTAKLDGYDRAEKGSLAELVESKNKYAKKFINMLLGRVMCCERVEELKQYDIAITKDCLRYQNHVISSIPPKNYQVPYIGADAYQIQKELTEKKEQELKQEIKNIEQELEEIKTINILCDIKIETEIKYGMNNFLNARKEQKKIEKLRREKIELNENSNYIEKQLKLQRMEKEQKEQEQEYEILLKKQGEAEKIQKLVMEEREDLKEENKQKDIILKFAEEKLGEELQKFELEYEKEYGKKYKKEEEQREEKIKMPEKKRDFAVLQKKISARRSRLERSIQEEEAKVISAMQEYRLLFQFGAEASINGYSAYYQEYDRLKNSEILNYEERTEKAREASEQEFKEQFLAKLQENMKQAQKEFRELNHSLSDIPFGREHYKFECMPAKKYESFYKMIMSDFNIMSGVSIFSGTFHENHREVIEELFERLLAGGENGAALVEEFTDYRSYMDYDIRMEHEDGSYSYYSKVCKEKSGGETQTPFYVTVAASFVQLYANGIGGDSIGIVLFDEAFNNMDDERIGGVLGFFKALPLQLVIAAPPEKIQYIAPLVDSTLLVIQEEKRSYVEEFAMK